MAQLPVVVKDTSSFYINVFKDPLKTIRIIESEAGLIIYSSSLKPGIITLDSFTPTDKHALAHDVGYEMTITPDQ